MVRFNQFASRMIQFKNELSRLFKKYPYEFLISSISAIFLTISIVTGFYSWVNDATRDKNELLKEEIAKLEKENKSLKSLNEDMLILYSDSIIFKTEQPVSKNESVAFLNGKVILKVDEIYADSVRFEFSFEGQPLLKMEERWKEGSITNRIPFEFEGTSYFILINKLSMDSVEFSVYLKD